MFACFMRLGLAQETLLDPQIVTANQDSFIEPHIQQFNREDFEHAFFNLSDFLKSHSGIQIQESGLGSPTSISIRGSSHKQVKFIIDGHEVNDSLYGNFDLNSIPLQQIESITLIQGNSATSNHADAVGGTILITTLSPNRQETSIRVGMGSFGLKEAGVALPWNYFGIGNMSLEYIEGKNDYEYVVDNPFDSNELSNELEAINNNNYEKLSALIKWNNKPELNWNTGIKLHYLEDEKRLPDYQRNRPVNNAYFGAKSTNLHTYFDFKVSDAIKSKSQLTIIDKDETYSDLESVFGLGASLVHYQSEIIDLSSALSIQQSRFSYLASAEIKQEQFEDNHPLISDEIKCLSPTSTCDTRSNQDQTSFNQTLSLFSHQQNHHIHLSYKLINNKRKKLDLYGLKENYKNEDNHTTWSSQYNYFGLEYVQPSLIISKSIRIPTLYELFGDRGLLKSNLSLEPETSYNISLNTRIQTNSVLMNHSLFYRDLKDAIVGQFSSGTGTYKNLNSAKIAGWQGSITREYTQTSLEINWTIQDSLSRSEVFASNNKKLPSIFHKIGNIRISNNFSKYITGSYTFHIARDMYVNTNNTAKHSGVETHSIRAMYRQFNSIISASIENIFDSRYNDQFNRPAAGRLLSIKLQYTF